MNEILFRAEVVRAGLDIYLPKKYQKKKPNTNHIRKEIKIKKDIKVIKLIPKSMKQKIKDVSNKGIFINGFMAESISDLKKRCN